MAIKKNINTPPPPRFSLDLIGKKFNYLLVLERSESKSNADKCYWYKCLCDCGKETFGKGSEIKNGRKKSCGCKNWLSKWKPFRRHPLYEVWHSMMQRCTNKNYWAYPDYGGRGIKVCEQWHNYETFYADNIERYNTEYKKRYHFDRRDNNGGYEDSNVRFISIPESARNKRGVLLTLEKAEEIRKSNLKATELAELYGVKVRAIYAVKENRTWIQ